MPIKEYSSNIFSWKSSQIDACIYPDVSTHAIFTEVTDCNRRNFFNQMNTSKLEKGSNMLSNRFSSAIKNVGIPDERHKARLAVQGQTGRELDDIVLETALL